MTGFMEKPRGDGGRINGGFFVCQSQSARLHRRRLSPAGRASPGPIAESGQLDVRHDGFWQAMDTLRDKNQLEDLWQRGEAKWKVWA